MVEARRYSCRCATRNRGSSSASKDTNRNPPNGCSAVAPSSSSSSALGSAAAAGVASIGGGFKAGSEGHEPAAPSSAYAPLLSVLPA